MKKDAKNEQNKTKISVIAPLNGLEPPAFRFTPKRDRQMRHRGLITSWLFT